ncbi:protein FAM180B [Oryzias latipes]|uniref:protein FAM180B n=1 Tax=Oryzias latipes TaxID=8090 RepID=UPI0005CC2F19|nr:protein FAM180B [Oryzias latipes]
MSPHLKFSLLIILWFCFDHVTVVAEGRHPTSSLPDADLMFEILLGGVTVDRYNNVLLQDEELASMRQGRDFLSQINDGVPKTLTSMKLLARTLEEGQKAPLTQGQFETVVLSVAFSAHQAYSQKSTEEREAWGEVLLQLANTTVNHLRGSFLFNYA